MKIILASYLYNEDFCIEKMLKSVMPHVDGGYIMIDDRTNDRTEEICLDYGCITRKFKFENFGKTRNMSLSWIKDKSGWHIRLDGDESLDFSSVFVWRELIHISDAKGLECIRTRRKDWDNINMSGLPIEDKMHPARIIKNNSYPRVHTEKYVHETVVGHTATGDCDGIIINHFEPYWSIFNGKNKYDRLEFFDALARKQEVEKGYNIWPDKKWDEER